MDGIWDMGYGMGYGTWDMGWDMGLGSGGIFTDLKAPPTHTQWAWGLSHIP